MGGYFLITFTLLTCCLQNNLVKGGENTKSIPYEVEVPSVRCHESTRCIYRWWWWWSCHRESYQDCYMSNQKEVRYRKVCLDGWTGDGCDIPICKKSCMVGYTCVAPDECQCLTSGGACTSVPCSSQKSCYPGTCSRGSCRCPSSFGGSDCTDISAPPRIESCVVTIQGSSGKLTEGHCGFQGDTPAEIMINSLNWKQIFMTVEVKSTQNWNVPSSAGLGHIQFPVKLGVARTKFKIFKDDIPVTEKDCDITPEVAKDYYKCVQELDADPLNLAHGTRIIVAAHGSLGGVKVGSRMAGNDNSYFEKATFAGIDAERKVVFKIDVQPPEHCYKTGDCNFFPVQMERDVTSEPEVQLSFSGWDDKDSGIKYFHVRVFLMQLSSDDFFETVGKPFVDRILRPADPDVGSFVFICKKAGVHSVEVAVFDGANNTAKARNIFVYTGSAELRTNVDRPIVIKGTRYNSATGEYWLTDEAIHRRPATLELSWPGHFASEARFTSGWSFPVRPWDGEGIDDNPQQRKEVGIGRRTIFKMKQFQDGLANYSLSYYVDKEEGGISEEYKEHVDFPSTVTDHGLEIGTSAEGTTIGIRLTALDVSGSEKEEKFKVRIDTSAPRLINFTMLRNDPDIYTSRVRLLLEDRQSGIGAVGFALLQVLDESLESTIRVGEAAIIRRSPPPLTDARLSRREAFVGECRREDVDCYCTPYRSCFSTFQFIDINHCDIDRQVKADSNIFVSFEASNEAGLSTKTTRVELKDVKDLQCRPAFKLSAAQASAVVIGSLIGLILLSFVLALLVRIYIFKRPAPLAVAHAYSNFRSRMQGHREDPKDCPNQLYISADDDDDDRKQVEATAMKYNKSKSGRDGKVTDDCGQAIDFISEEDVNVTDEISKGSQMVISKGFFNDGKAKVPVAIKSLKNGSSQKAIAAMNSKTECLATLPPHENVIRVLGLMKSNRGHMIVMEYCEMTLKNWLAKAEEVNPDLLDDVLTFAINVGRGVQHLHDNDIVHKRLAVRNVLLMRQFNQWVAKIIGFGGKTDTAGENASVPIKWLAPETLSTIAKNRPTYTEKSDSWSYGIMLWEMFTLGKNQPYPDLGSSEAKNKIISGEIMNRPDDCPPDLYEKVMWPCWARNPKERPNFAEISRLVENFKKGENGEQIGYYASDDKDRSPTMKTKKMPTNHQSQQAYYTDGS